MHSNSRREGELGVGAEVGSLWGSKEKERGKNGPQGGRKRYKCILLLFRYPVPPPPPPIVC